MTENGSHCPIYLGRGGGSHIRKRATTNTIQVTSASNPLRKTANEFEGFVMSYLGPHLGSVLKRGILSQPVAFLSSIARATSTQAILLVPTIA